jgi:hypothetical protein
VIDATDQMKEEPQREQQRERRNKSEQETLKVVYLKLFSAKTRALENEPGPLRLNRGLYRGGITNQNLATSLQLVVSDLVRDEVQSLLASSGDLAAALFGLLGQLEIIERAHDGADDARGSVLVDLRARSAAVAATEALLQGADASAGAQVDFSDDGGCKRHRKDTESIREQAKKK